MHFYAFFPFGRGVEEVGCAWVWEQGEGGRKGVGKAEGGYRWEEGGVRGRGQSEPTPNLQRGEGDGREERLERVGRREAEWLWNKFILQPHNKKDEW